MKRNFIKNCAKKYGSPLYLYDLNKIDTSYKNLKNSIPKNSKILYSIKANPNKEIIKGLENENEDILVKSYSFEEVKKKMENNEILNGLTLIALQWFFLNIYKS